jgi:hypothetical protein
MSERNAASHSALAAVGSAARCAASMASGEGLNARRALHDQHVVVVNTEMVAPLLVQKANLAVRRADADQHPAGGRQGRQDRGVNLGI